MVPTVVIDLVDQLKVKYSIKLILEVLNIPKSTYYRWKNKTHKNDTITQKVIELCKANHYTYGYRKITALINQCYTSPINHKRVQRMMQKHHLNCRVRPKKTTRIGKPYYKTDNLLQRQFKASCPKEQTTVIIAHRLSTIKQVDKIIFLDEGSITGIGNHEELYTSHKKYKKFVNSQMRGDLHS